MKYLKSRNQHLVSFENQVKLLYLKGSVMNKLWKQQWKLQKL